MASAVTDNLQAAQSKNRPAHLPQKGRPEFEPDHKEHHHHAELGEVHDIVALSSEAHGIGPDDRAGQQVTDHGAQPQTLGQRHRDDRREQIDESLIKSAAHFTLGCRRCFTNYKLAKRAA